MKKVKTHKFGGTRYKIEYAGEINGIFDPEGKTITIISHKKHPLKSLSSALEEGLHAMGVPDKYLHKPEARVKKGKSLSKVDDLARFILRLGYEKK